LRPLSRPLVNKIEAKLESLVRSGRFRTLVATDRLPNGRVGVDGAVLVDLSSNDYLGLSRSNIGTANPFTGAAGSRLLGGNRPQTGTFESQFSSWLGVESALLLNSGYHANLAVMSTLFGPSDLILVDRLVHASIWDGIRLSGAKWARFDHNDPEHCRRLVAENRDSVDTILIVTESVFSMDGDRAPLVELAEIATEYGVGLMVDESHALGVFGPQGRGCVAELDVQAAVDIWVSGLGKAWGGIGGIVGGSGPLISLLTSAARPFIYSTALPDNAVAWAMGVLTAMPELDGCRQRLQILAKRLGFPSHIGPIMGGDLGATMTLSNELKSLGYWAPVIKPPTVPPNQCRIRCSLSVLIPDEDIARLETWLKSR